MKIYILSIQANTTITKGNTYVLVCTLGYFFVNCTYVTST